jgi:hypothetical protein
MSKKVKSFLYNFLGFVVIYLPTLYLVGEFTHLNGLWIPMTAFMVALLLAPKFQYGTEADTLWLAEQIYQDLAITRARYKSGKKYDLDS